MTISKNGNQSLANDEGIIIIANTNQQLKLEIKTPEHNNKPLSREISNFVNKCSPRGTNIIPRSDGSVLIRSAIYGVSLNAEGLKEVVAVCLNIPTCQVDVTVQDWID